MELSRIAGPYSPRNSMYVKEAMTGLLSEPEIKLSDVDEAQVTEYGHALVKGYLSPSVRVSEGYFKNDAALTLGEVILMPVGATTISFSKDYLVTAAGADDVRGLSLPPDRIPETLYSRLSQSEITDKKAFKSVAIRSNKWFRETLTNSFETDDQSAQISLTGDTINLDLDPNRTIEKASAIQAYRDFYRQALRRLKDEQNSHTSQDLLHAKRVQLDVHIGRVNALMALHYPHLFHLAEQLDMSPDNNQTQTWKNALLEAAPVIKFADASDGEKRSKFFDGFARRLDIVRNGRAVAYDSDGSALPISHDVERLADEVELRSQNPSEKVPSSRFTVEQLEEMARTRMNAEEFSTFLETVLADKGLLSVHKTTHDDLQERSGTAEDNKWQVVISPKAASLSVEGSRKAMIVAENFDRTLTQLSPTGCLPLAAHEVAHVYQVEVNDEVAKQIPLAAIRGRRSVTVEELGGLFFERKVFDEFGINRKTNTMYVRGLQEKLAGGNITDVAWKMYETVRKYNGVAPDKGRQVAMTAIRLYRHAGHNSQPLDYIEQELLAEELRQTVSPENIASFAITASSFSLHDAAALHQAGLFNLPQSAAADPAEDVLRIYQDSCPKA